MIALLSTIFSFFKNPKVILYSIGVIFLVSFYLYFTHIKKKVEVLEQQLTDCQTTNSNLNQTIINLKGNIVTFQNYSNNISTKFSKIDKEEYDFALAVLTQGFENNLIVNENAQLKCLTENIETMGGKCISGKWTQKY